MRARRDARIATEPEPGFVAEVAAYKAGENTNQVSARPFYRRRTVRYLQQSLRNDPDNAEARRTMLLAQESLKVTRSSLLGSAVLGVLATTLQLIRESLDELKAVTAGK
jgi:hypothetical protein